MAGIFGAIGGAIATAAKAANAKNSGTGSSPAVAASPAKTTGTGSSTKTTGSYDPNFDYAAAIKNETNTAAKQSYLDGRLSKLGGTADPWQEAQQAALNAAIAGQNKPANSYQQATNGYLDDYAQKQAAIRAEREAKVKANISQLDAQRPLVQQAGAQANAAAQQNYYGLLDPNGAAAERRAALGLSSSGVTESSAIAAGNAYGSAVNANAQNVENQLRQIELAKTQAQLTGDIATAQQLQSYYDTVLQNGMQAAGNIAQLQQWGVENSQTQAQQAFQNKLAEAGLTGRYNGQQTLAGQEAQRAAERAVLEFRGMDLQNQMAELTLMLEKTYGWKREQAELAIMQAQLQGQNVENLYRQAQVDFARRQMK